MEGSGDSWLGLFGISGEDGNGADFEAGDGEDGDEDGGDGLRETSSNSFRRCPRVSRMESCLVGAVIHQRVVQGL